MKQTINEGTANAAGYARLVDEVRRTKPLIQQLTNFVTVNDCANMTLAIGASPIMADAIEEAGEIAAIAGAVVLNMGAINARTVPAMIAAGKAANSAGVPVVFDPVGAGASTYRNVTAELFMREMQVDVLRGNISEVRFLAGHAAQTKGVDAADGDELHREDAMELARALAAARGCVVAITGKTDIVSDGKRVIAIENGHSMLACLTGTGCMCTALIGSFCGAAPDQVFEATVAALLTMGIAGEIAYEKAGSLGNGSFRVALHDAVSLMDAETITRRAHIL